VADLLKSASATIVVNVPGSNNASLKGRYAFVYHGTNPFAAGSFVADGAGNISASVIDTFSRTSQSQSPIHDSTASAIGAYFVGPNNQGEVALLATD
jgi:hypothetical protein